MSAHTDPSLRSTDPICSVSESLAHGMVSRLALESDRRQNELHARLGGPPISAKRAAAFRGARQWLLGVVPDHLQAAELHIGDRTGKRKDAKFGLLHWDTSAPSSGKTGDLVLLASIVDARHVELSHLHLASVTRHALMRLFYRLKTTEQAPVMKELAGLARGCSVWMGAMARMAPQAELLLPSALGAFVVARDRDDPETFIIRTWMDDARMVDNLRRQRAVAAARREGGLVVNLLPNFPILSSQRLLEAGLDMESSERADIINSVLDRQFDERTRLPADWRFIDAAQRQAWREADDHEAPGTERQRA